jgi:hypothetical protein
MTTNYIRIKKVNTGITLNIDVIVAPLLGVVNDGFGVNGTRIRDYKTYFDG